MIPLKRTGNRHAIKRIIKPSPATPSKRGINKDHDGKQPVIFQNIIFNASIIKKTKALHFLNSQPPSAGLTILM